MTQTDTVKTGPGGESGRLLLVDDDAGIRELLTEYLGREGFTVLALEDGRELLKTVADWAPDLLVLDIMLPGEDGFSLCERLRRSSDLPVIMLTASGGEQDRIVGLELGADDYLAKPFNPRELLARIRGILRRSHSHPETADRSSQSVVRYHFGDRSLDMTTRTLRLPGGAEVSIAGAEFKLLSLFLAAGNETLPRDTISEALYGRDCGPFDRSIDVAVSRLRQRLGDDARHPELILTHRGSGYVLGVEVHRDLAEDAPR